MVPGGDSYLAAQPREFFQVTTRAGMPVSAAQGGKERSRWRLKCLAQMNLAIWCSFAAFRSPCSSFRKVILHNSPR